jgi:hypothetical protein
MISQDSVTMQVSLLIKVADYVVKEVITRKRKMCQYLVKLHVNFKIMVIKHSEQINNCEAISFNANNQR